jgi:hypothetical protein
LDPGRKHIIRDGDVLVFKDIDRREHRLSTLDLRQEILHNHLAAGVSA